MPDPTDRALVRRVAEMMGWKGRHSLNPDDVCLRCGLYLPDGECEGHYFEPLTDWRDFGEVWEWAEARGLAPGMAQFCEEDRDSENPELMFFAFAGGAIESVKSTSPRRALLLALVRAGEGA